METKEEILAKHEGCLVETINDSECMQLSQDVVLPAMEEYALVKMIAENESILEMAKLHMDERAVLVLNERISTLWKELFWIQIKFEE